MGIQAMKDCAKHGYYVEACLSSNKETGIITKRKEYPLGLMLLLDVKVMLGTDGGDVYYTDLKTEYAHAKKVLNHFLAQINNSSAEPIKLPNGDLLQYAHVKHLFKNIPQAQGWDDKREIQFADLKLIEAECKQKVNMNQLVDNMNDFKGKMFPGHSNKAALVGEQIKVSIPSGNVDLTGVRLFTGASGQKTSKGVPCIEVSCSNQNQSDYIASILASQNIKVYEVVHVNGFWRVKAEKTLEGAEAVSKLLDAQKTVHAHTTSQNVDLSNAQLFTQNRKSSQGPCYEIVCKTQDQANHIKVKLQEQNVNLHEVLEVNGLWCVKFAISPQAAQVAANLIGKPASDKEQKQPQKEQTAEKKEQFKKIEIENWLFNNGPAPAGGTFPQSKLDGHHPEKYAPKKDSSTLIEVGGGILSNRVQIHSGSITDIKIEAGKKGAVATSNNGDLLTGCGYAVAKAIINAAGAGLQTEVYNRFGVPGVMRTPQFGKDNYSKTEGRGYAISCDSYDMKATHNIDKIEMLTVPYDISKDNEEGVVNMYYEAFVHNKDFDYMLVPMAGMSHPLLENSSDKSARLTMDAFEKFVRDYPDSKLKLVCAIFNDKDAENNYKNHAFTKDAIFEKELKGNKQEKSTKPQEDQIKKQQGKQFKKQQELKKTLAPHKTQLEELLHTLEEKTEGLKNNAKTDNGYKKIAKMMEELCTILNKEKSKFFENPSPVSFKKFQVQCMNAILKVENDEATTTHRGWHQVHPILRGIVGVLAAITIIPALVVAASTDHGYFQTFFGEPKTDSSQKVREFKQKFKDEIENIQKIEGVEIAVNIYGNGSN